MTAPRLDSGVVEVRNIVYRPDHVLLPFLIAPSPPLYFIAEAVLMESHVIEKHLFHDLCCRLVCGRGYAVVCRKGRCAGCFAFVIRTL